MAGETQITVVGNLTADPELRYTNSGLAVVNFTIASTPRSFNKETKEWEDGEPLFLRASAWRDAAENISKSLTKGMRVIAQGGLKQRKYTDKDGNERVSLEIEIEEVGPSLRYATATTARHQSSRTQQDNRGRAAASTDDPWEAAPAAQVAAATGVDYGEETPF